MDKNIISGNGKQITGTIKKTVGKLSGNTELELEGKAEIALGKGEVALGALTDKAKDAAKDVAQKTEHAANILKAKSKQTKT